MSPIESWLWAAVIGVLLFLAGTGIGCLLRHRDDEVDGW